MTILSPRSPSAGIALAGLMACTGSAAAGAVHQQTVYYAVRGDTLAELQADLARNGPAVSHTGMRHPGSITIDFGGRVTYDEGDRDCAVDRPSLTLDLAVHLPRWAPPETAAASTKVAWTVLVEDIRTHENRHAAIARNWLKRMEMALKNLAPEANCAAMRRQAQTVIHRYLGWHREAQLEFDRKESHRISNRVEKRIEARLAALGLRR